MQAFFRSSGRNLERSVPSGSIGSACCISSMRTKHGASSVGSRALISLPKARVVLNFCVFARKFQVKKCGYGCQDMPVLPLPVSNTNFQLAYAEVVAGNKQLTTLEMATLSHWQHLQRFQRVRIEKKIPKTDICDAYINGISTSNKYVVDLHYTPNLRHVMCLFYLLCDNYTLSYDIMSIICPNGRWDRHPRRGGPKIRGAIPPHHSRKSLLRWSHMSRPHGNAKDSYRIIFLETVLAT